MDIFYLCLLIGICIDKLYTTNHNFHIIRIMRFPIIKKIESKSINTEQQTSNI